VDTYWFRPYAFQLKLKKREYFSRGGEGGENVTLPSNPTGLQEYLPIFNNCFFTLQNEADELTGRRDVMSLTKAFGW
jgi:hypothetical protein